MTGKISVQVRYFDFSVMVIPRCGFLPETNDTKTFRDFNVEMLFLCLIL